ncbi:sensor domain-containing protein [Rhodococcus sp. KBS0724]|uniref:sensor domain-containing protein n=1 Tax=Rhodococcus sp. KBS0724 TaxID=1179674 RepID=UPI0021B0E3D0|nr:sensor domain-containing protein [Rhodococcus sp. KBS0724]
MDIVMSRRVVAGLGAVAVLFVGGCGSETSSPTAPDSTPVSTPVPGVALAPFSAAPVPTALTGTPLDKVALAQTVLTLSELPADFDIVPDPVEDLGLAPAPATSESDKSSTDPAACAAVLAPIATQVPGSVSSISKMFTGPDFTSIDQDSASFADGAAAAAAFETMQQTVTSCSQFTGTDADGINITYQVGAGYQPTVGDASFSYRIMTASEGFTLVADVVVAAAGSNLTQISATAPTPIAPEVLGSMAGTAVERLRTPAA